LTGHLQVVLDLNIPNIEQNQISLDFSILMLTLIFLGRFLHSLKIFISLVL